jgi:hypothetical protein
MDFQEVAGLEEIGMSGKRLRVAFASFLLLLLGAASLQPGGAAEPACLEFSFLAVPGRATPQAWEPLTFPKISRHTVYTVVEEAGKTSLRAQADASASALVREIEVNPREYPILLWSWKVENTIEKGDETKKEGDDYAARVYVNFRYDPEKASLWERTQYGIARTLYGGYPPKGALNYIWANKLSAGKSIDNAYTARAKMVAVQSGTAKVGQWVNEKRNLYQDYRAVFGEEPPVVIGLAVMTDTDNTGEKAVAYYRDISLCRG